MASRLRIGALFLVLVLLVGVLPMPASATAPPVPTPQSPGYSTQFGEVISTLTPTLQWSSVSGANNYHVAIRQYDGSWDSGPIVLDQGYIYATSYKVPSGVLEAGESYRWNVRAFNSGGEASDWSSRLYFQTQSPSPVLNSASCSSCVADYEQHPLTLSGSNFVDGNTLTLTDPSNEVFQSVASKLTVNSASKITYQLNPGTDDGEWKVRVNSADGSQQSATRSFTVSAPTNDPPSCSRDSPSQGVSLQTNQQQAFTATCHDPEGEWLGNAWNLDGAPQGGSDSPPASSSWTFSRTFSFPDPGTYSLMVGAADNANQQSNFISWSITVSSPDQPQQDEDEPPTCSRSSPSQGVSLQANQEQTFTATCYDAEGEWSDEVWTLDGESYGESATPPSSSSWTTSRTISWSTEGTHTLSMAALDTAGQASDVVTWSITVTADQSSPTVPVAPSGLTRTVGNDQVGLEWSAPSSDGGSDITNYRVYRGTSSGSLQLVTNGGCANLGVTLSCTDTGLSAGQTYHYTVRAVNSEGESDPSNQVSATISYTQNDNNGQLADLVINEISFNPDPPVAGEPVAVTCTYSNRADASGTGSTFSVHISIGEETQTASASALAPDQSSSTTFTFTDTYNAGSHSVVCEVNKDRAVAESNYDNSGATVNKGWEEPVDEEGVKEDQPQNPVDGGEEPADDEATRTGTGYFFIHGICSTGFMWTEEGEDGYAVWDALTANGPGDRKPNLAPTYGPVDSGQRPQSMARLLQVNLDQFIDHGGPDGRPLEKVILVGHSNGGLMARWLLNAEIESNRGDRIERVVTLDSPDRGADANGFSYWALQNNGRAFLPKYVGGGVPCSESWAAWSYNFLDQNTGGDISWITTLANSTSNDERLVRFLFADCSVISKGYVRGQKLPDRPCLNGNVVVGRAAAEVAGAILLSPSPKTDAERTDARNDACNLRGPNEGDGLLGVVLSSDGVGTYEDRPALGGHTYHSDGVQYFGHYITAVAKFGVDGLRGHPDFLDCMMVKALHTGSIGATITPREVTVGSDPSILEMVSEVHTPGMQVDAAALLENGAPKTLQIKVDSQEHDGKTIVANLPFGYLSLYDSNQVLVKLDGEVVQRASSYESVLDPADPSHDGQPRYWVLSAGSNGLQILVSVPHYSERTIEIAAIEETGQVSITPLDIVAMAAGVILLAAGAYNLGRRR